uniref:Transmembrane protein n=1 Tax=Macrostomum lignano TaxID=282301 RepID=A0A1I8F1Q7_9PLAT
ANVLKAERVIQQRVTQEDQRRKHRAGRPATPELPRGPVFSEKPSVQCADARPRGLPEKRRAFQCGFCFDFGVAFSIVGCNLATIVGCSLATIVGCNLANYRWLQSCTGNPVRCYVSPQASAEGGRAAPAIRSFLKCGEFHRLFLCAVCFDWPVFHGSQTEARQTSSAMPASDSEPQRQVVYEPCVRPSELLRRQRLPTEASAEQPTGCWPATRQFVVGLDCCDAGDGASSACCSSSSSFHSASHRSTQSVASVPKLPQSPPSPSASRLHPQPRASAAAAPAAAACETLVAVRLWLPGLQSPLPPPAESPPTPPSARPATSSGGSRTRRAGREPGGGFYNGFRVAGELLLLLLSVPLLLLLLHCLLLLSGIGGQPALLQADWLQFLKFFEGLPEKRAHFGANSISRLSRLQLREGRVLLAPRPRLARQPALTQALPIFSGYAAASSSSSESEASSRSSSAASFSSSDTIRSSSAPFLRSLIASSLLALLPK